MTSKLNKGALIDRLKVRRSKHWRLLRTSNSQLGNGAIEGMGAVQH